jgi:hypothetical protein
MSHMVEAGPLYHREPIVFTNIGRAEKSREKREPSREAQRQGRAGPFIQNRARIYCEHGLEPICEDET